MDFIYKVADFFQKHYESISLSPILKKYSLFFIGVVVLYLVFKIIIPVVLHRFEKLAHKTKNDFDEYLVDMFLKIRWPVCLAIVLLVGNQLFALPAKVHLGIKWFLILFLTYWTIKVVTLLVTYGFHKVAERKGPGASSLLPVFAKITNTIVWITGGVFVISNLGYEVTPLVTGLGIGGIAIALAVQNILSDLFSSVSIYMDKPFKVGDFIVVGKMKGTVKAVGIKTTRITALDGEELVIPNKQIVDSTIQNYKKMQKRRVAFNIGVTYETKSVKLKKIPDIIKKIIKGVKDTEFGRVHFYKFEDSNLNFEVVYFVLSNDYEKYMDIQESINYKLVEAFEKEKIEFAYPTQKVFVGK